MWIPEFAHLLSLTLNHQRDTSGYWSTGDGQFGQTNHVWDHELFILPLGFWVQIPESWTYVAEKNPGEMFNMFQPKMFHIVP